MTAPRTGYSPVSSTTKFAVGLLLVIGLLLLMASWPSSAQAAVNSLIVTCVAPTQRTDGTALTNLAKHTYEYGTCSTTDTFVAPPLGSVTTTGTVCGTTIPNLAPGKYCVRVTASDAGGVASAFSNTANGMVTTIIPPDTTPDAFTFLDAKGVPLSTVQTSAPITVAGITAAAPISVTGGTYSVGCGTVYGSAAGTVTNGQTVCLRHTSSATVATVTNTVLNIGGVTGVFMSTTVAAPNPPTNVAITVNTVAFEWQPNYGMVRVGYVPLGTVCGEQYAPRPRYYTLNRGQVQITRPRRYQGGDLYGKCATV